MGVICGQGLNRHALTSVGKNNFSKRNRTTKLDIDNRGGGTERLRKRKGPRVKKSNDFKNAVKGHRIIPI